MGSPIDNLNFVKRRRKPQTQSSFNEQTRDYLNDLSDEILLSILNYLPKHSLASFAQVCRRFHSLALDPSLWPRINISSQNIRSSDLNTILRRGTLYLKMFSTTVIGSVLHPLDYSIKMAMNENLQTLNLTMCNGLCLQSITEITQKLKKLRHLNIGWTQLDDASLTLLCQTIQPSVEQLCLSGCRQTMNDDCVENLVRRAQHLRVLDLSDSNLITDKSINVIIRYLRQLEHVSFSRCYTIAPIAYASLKKLDNLVALDIFGVVDDRGIQKLRAMLGSKIQINKYHLSSRLGVMEPTKVKEKYHALKAQRPTRTLVRCDSTDVLPQTVQATGIYSNICSKAPDALFRDRKDNPQFEQQVSDNRKISNSSYLEKKRPGSGISNIIDYSSLNLFSANNSYCDDTHFNTSAILPQTKEVSSVHIVLRPIDLSNLLPLRARLTVSDTSIMAIGHNYLNNLSDELLLSILRYLPKRDLASFAQVCRRFRSLAYDSSLWFRVDMSRKQILSLYLHTLLLRGVIVLKMYQTTVNGSLLYPSNQLAFTKLQYLDLTMATITQECLFNLINSCRLLKKLSLESLELNCKIICKLVLNEQLETLNLTMCTGLDSNSIRELTLKLKQLRHLNIGWTQLDDASLTLLCQTIQPSVEQLCLSGCRQTMNDDC
ncbi:unnamed protein product, partial [Didymodactylos carnosus]